MKRRSKCPPMPSKPARDDKPPRKSLPLGLGFTAYDDGTLQYIESPRHEVILMLRDQVPFTIPVMSIAYNSWRMGIQRTLRRLESGLQKELADLAAEYPAI